MQYCRICGTRLIGNQCHKCGKNYQPKDMDLVKHHLKRHIHRNYNVHVPSTPKIVLLVVIVAIVVLVSYLIFSQPAGNSKLTTPSTQSLNTNIPAQNQITSTQQQPALRTYHQMVNQFGGSLGCFGRVDGGVTNNGNADAQNVVVTCTAEEISTQKDIGLVKPGETKSFEAILNYDCQHWRVEECQATCSNC